MFSVDHISIDGYCTYHKCIWWAWRMHLCQASKNSLTRLLACA